MVAFEQVLICKFALFPRIPGKQRLNQFSSKALALGADFVQLGRPMLWGLAHDSEKVARHVLKSLLEDFDLTVALSGHQSLSSVNRTALVASNML